MKVLGGSIFRGPELEHYRPIGLQCIAFRNGEAPGFKVTLNAKQKMTAFRERQRLSPRQIIQHHACLNFVTAINDTEISDRTIDELRVNEFVAGKVKRT